MGKKILMYKENIIYSIVILATLLLTVMLYSGVKEGYFNIFLLAMIIGPIVLIIGTNNNLKVDLIFAVITVSAITAYAIIFWKYKDGILFNKTDISQIAEEYRMQFSFENDLKLNLLFTCSSISALISILIRFVYSKLKVIKGIY
jgi:hypothetical protein